MSVKLKSPSYLTCFWPRSCPIFPNIYLSEPLMVLYVLLKIRTAHNIQSTGTSWIYPVPQWHSLLSFSCSYFLSPNTCFAHLPSLELRFSQNYYYAKILFPSDKSASRLFLYDWNELFPFKTLYMYAHQIVPPTHFVMWHFTTFALSSQAPIQIPVELCILTHSTKKYFCSILQRPVFNAVQSIHM